MAKKFYKHGWLIHQLRRLTLKFPPRLKVLNSVKTTRYHKSAKGTDVKRCFYKCMFCETEELKSTQINLDHKEPVGQFKDWNTYVENLFCDEENWQVLCIPCHEEKTKKENETYVKKTVAKKIRKR